MRNSTLLSMMATAMSGLGGLLPGMPAARTPYPWEVAEMRAKERAEAPPAEVDTLTKRERKIYNKVLIETQSRDAAWKAVLDRR